MFSVFWRASRPFDYRTSSFEPNQSRIDRNLTVPMARTRLRIPMKADTADPIGDMTQEIE
jgi:hypothetical protein